MFHTLTGVITGNTWLAMISGWTRLVGVLAYFAAANLAASGVLSSAEEASRIRAFVSVPPHAHLVERVGGERVDVRVLVEGSANPHTYSPAPSQVNALLRARVFFRTGMPFEAILLSRLGGGGTDLRIVDLRDGVEPLDGTCGSGMAGSSSTSGGDHDDHGGEDPHIWLSPRLAIEQAGSVRDTLIALDPDHRLDYERRHDVLVAELEALHGRLSEQLEPLRGGSIFVYHPAFGHFCREYGLRQVAVETGSHGPAPRALRSLISRARAEGVQVIIVQPQFSAKSAEIIAEAIDGVVAVVDPLARHFLNSLEELGRTVERYAAPR